MDVTFFNKRLTGYGIGRAVSVNNTTPFALTNTLAPQALLGWFWGVNTTGTTIFVQLYDSANAPTVGTDIPVITIPLPANTINGGIANPWLPPDGLNFYKGAWLAFTANAASSDNTAVGAGAGIVQWGAR